MTNEELARIVRALEARLARLEASLDLPPDPVSPDPASSDAADKCGVSSPSPIDEPPSSPPATAAPPPAAAPPTTPASQPADDDTRHVPDDVPTPATIPPPAPISAPSARAPREPFSLEQFLGGRFAAWAGAAILFLAALFAIKIAIDKGWWGMLAPTWKALLIAGAGVTIIGAGEIVLRRVGRVASLGLFGAGLSILYLDAFATFRFWDLLSIESAFLLMGAVAVGGFALTLRTSSLAIGVFSIVGGFLTPLLLRGQVTHDVELLTYLTVLWGIALALAVHRPTPFGPMRFVAFGGLCVVAFGWLLANGPTAWMMGVLYLSGWWTMALGAALTTALRGRSAIGNIVLTLAATIAFTLAGTWILSTGPIAGTDWSGVFTAAVGLIAAGAALHFGPGLDGLRRRAQCPIDALAIALWIQAGMLLITAAALHFDDAGRAVSWIVIAVGAVETGRRLPSRGLDVFGLIVGALAVVDVLGVSWVLAPSLTRQVTTVGPITITGWSILAALLTAATIAIALRLRITEKPMPRGVVTAIAALATLLWALWWIVTTTGATQTAGWLVGVAALTFAAHRGARWHGIALATTALAMTAARWGLVDLLLPRVDRMWRSDDQVPFLNLPSALGVAIVALGLWQTRLIGRRRPDRASDTPTRSRAAAISTGFTLAMVVALWALSFEVDRLLAASTPSTPLLQRAPEIGRGLWFTLLWTVGAFLSFAFSRRHTLPVLHVFGLGVVFMGTAFWLGPGTLGWRMGHAPLPGMPILNLPALVGAALLGQIVVLQHWLRRADAPLRAARGVLIAVAGVLVLWLGTLELDRLFIDDRTVRLASITVYWALLGIAIVALGFRARHSAVRYAGLGLLGITAVKLIAIDMAGIDNIWRVISAAAIGLVLIATSVAYARLSPASAPSDGAPDDPAAPTPPSAPSSAPSSE